MLMPGKSLLTIERESQAITLYETMACALWVRDVSGHFLHINRHAFEMFGVPPQDGPIPTLSSLGWTLRDGAGRVLAETEFPSNAAIQTGQPQRHKLLGIDVGTGDIRWLVVDAIPVADEHGVIQRSVTTAVDVTDLKQSELALKASEERYRRIVDTTHEGVCLLDSRSTLTYVNRRFCQMLGYQSDEILGRPSFDLIVPTAGMERGRSPVIAGLRPGEPCDLALRHKDGTLVWTIISGSPMIGEDGLPSAVLVMFTDVTARKVSEDALRRSEARFRALIENGTDIIAIVDRDGVLSYISASVTRVTGHDESHYLGHNLFDYVHPDDLPGIGEAFHRLTENPGSVQYLQTRFQHSDGTWHFVEGLGVNRFEEPAIGGIVLNVRDVTEKRLAEDRARSAAALLEQLTADAVVVVDEEGRAVSWNYGAEQLFGWTREEVLGKPSLIVPPEMWDQGMIEMQRMMASGQTATMETIRVSRSGERIPVLGSWSRVVLEGGGIGSMSILKDMRAHLEAHRKLAEQAESLALLRERERIAMDLHDGVIQSLYGVTLTLGALRRQVAQQSPAMADQASSALSEAIGGLTISIERIREYIFNLRAGIPEERDLQAGLRALAHQFEGNTGITPRLILEANGRPLGAEAVTHLLHIAQEALSNITRHAHATSTTIELSHNTSRLRLAISDNGRGFEPGRKGRRAGDGLRNMRERARLLQGQLSIDSRPGRGTTMSVSIVP